MCVIGISGMVGVGKTTLVRQAYDHPKVSSLYEIRIMVRVGPYCNPRDLLLLFLGHLGFHFDTTHENLTEDDLKAHLSEALKGKRFLIVLDDVWSPQLNKVIRDALPADCDHKCRIILTTRLLEVISPSFPGYQVDYYHEKDY